MASRMDFSIWPFQPAAPVNNRQINISGPGVNATVFTNVNGLASYTYSVSGLQLPAGTYTITVVTNPGEYLADEGYAGNPITWVCSGPFQPNPTFSWRFLYSALLRWFVSADCPNRPTVAAAGAQVTFDGVTKTVGADGTVDFTTFGGIVSLAAASFGDSTFNQALVTHNGNLATSTLPYTVNLGRFPDELIGFISGFIWFRPPGGCGTAGTSPPTTLNLATGPWCLQSREGWYHEAYISSGIRYRRSDFPTPPFAINGRISSNTSDAEPRMVEVGRRLILLFTRPSGTTPNVYRSTSDDDGATWSPPTLMFPGCKHPTLNVHPKSNRTLYAAFRTTSGSRGQLKGMLQESGDPNPSTEFALQKTGGAPLLVDDDTFHFAPATEGPRRWTLVAKDGGNIVRYYSADDGYTWTLIP